MRESGFRYAEFMGHGKDLGILFLGKWPVTKRALQSMAREAFVGRDGRDGAVILSSSIILSIANVRTSNLKWLESKQNLLTDAAESPGTRKGFRQVLIDVQTVLPQPSLFLCYVSCLSFLLVAPFPPRMLPGWGGGAVGAGEVGDDKVAGTAPVPHLLLSKHGSQERVQSASLTQSSPEIESHWL